MVDERRRVADEQSVVEQRRVADGRLAGERQLFRLLGRHDHHHRQQQLDHDVVHDEDRQVDGHQCASSDCDADPMFGT